MDNSKTTVFSQRQLVQILTLLGLFLSLLVFIYIKSNPTLFALGGPFQLFIKDLGLFGPLIFIVIQIVQVIYPVIPGGLTCLLGHVVFGPFYGFIYNFSGIFLGSLLAFMLGRRFGHAFVKSFVKAETFEKYKAYLDKGNYFSYFLAAAFVLPGFPDDFLCMVAGLSKMSLKKFSLITLITKPATLYLYTVLSYQALMLVDKAII